MDSRFTEEQFWKMCDAHMSDPVPLKNADLSKPFVYERQYGIFYVPCGMHPLAMSTLLAFQHGCNDAVDVAEKLGLRMSSGTADRWLETTAGACFKSSQSKKISTWSAKSLNAFERRIFTKHHELMFLGET